MRYLVIPDDGLTRYIVVVATDGTTGLELVSSTDATPTQGAKGEQGIQGSVGPQGIPGTSNLILLHGNGPPSDVDPITPGIDGQLYIDDLTDNLYEREGGKWL